MEKIKASIVLPVYNVDKYLDECFESLLNQTYDNIEIIAVDDGATDNSSEIIKRYADIHKHIKYIRQNNMGLSGARNTGLKYCTGKYILFVDSDDILDITYVEKLVNKAELTNSDIVMCTHSRFFDKIENKEEQPISLNIDSTREYSGKEVAELMLRTKVPGYAWQKIFRRETLEERNFEFEVGRFIEDFYPIFKEVYAAKKITFIDEPLYRYRQRLSSISYVNSIERIRDFRHATKSIYELALSNKLNIKYINAFKAYSFHVIIHQYYDLRKSSEHFYREFYKDEISEEEPKIKEIFFNNDISCERKIKIILWKLRIFKILKDKH